MKGAPQSVTRRMILGLASYLGSTALTLLVRCPCGRRNYFDRRGWAWLEVAFCVRCWQAILYHDLRVVSRWEGERMLREDFVSDAEVKVWRSLEGRMRRFVLEFHKDPLWTWAPKVVRMALGVEADLHLADRLRARPGQEPAATPEELPAEVGVQDLGLTDEQRQLLTAFAQMSEERRARMLSYVEGQSLSYDELEGLEL